MAVLIKTLTLSLDTNSVECQLSQATLVDEPETEEISTFCGKETFATPAYKLNLAGFSDWTDVEGVCTILHEAYKADPTAEVDFVLSLGKAPGAVATRTGVAKPTKDVDFGGESGSAMKFEVTLDVVGVPTEGYTPATP